MNQFHGGTQSPNEFPYGTTAQYPTPAQSYYRPEPEPEHKSSLGGKLLVAGGVLLVAAGIVTTINLVKNDDAPASNGPVVAVPMSKDEGYIARLADNNVEATSGSTQSLIAAAHQVCSFRDQGYPQDYIVRNIYQGNQESNASLSLGQIRTVVNLSIDTYCPQYAR